MADVFIAGMAALDLVFRLDDLPRGEGKYRAGAATMVGGGCAANAAVAVARLGGGVRLAARLGRDRGAELILSALRAEGVGLDHVCCEAAATTPFSSIVIAPEGARQIVNFRGAAPGPRAHFDALPARCDVALADTRWRAGLRQTIRSARACRLPVVVDAEAPVSPQDIAGATHVAFSRPGLEAICPGMRVGAGLRRVAALTGAWVCVTDGAAGVHFLDGDAVKNIPAVPVRAVDTLGAGDVWHGAFALRLGEGAPEREAMRFANAAAALKCTRHGGGAGAPGRDEVERLLTT